MKNIIRVPKNFHFIYGLRAQTEPFHLVHYLCLKSCLEVNEPERIFFHHHHEPYGPWWEKIRPNLTLASIEPESLVNETEFYDQHQEGRFIKKWGLEYAHHADFLRLKIMIEQGGVYADIDTLFIRPYPTELYQYEFTLGREKPVRTPEGGISSSLCNAVIFSEPGAAFPQEWLEEMYVRFDGSWNRHSCLLAAELMRTNSSPLNVVPRKFFYPYMWTVPDLRQLFEEDSERPEECYSIHLWSHLWWDRNRTDFTQFCSEEITVDNILGVDTTFNRMARPFLSGNNAKSGTAHK